MSNFWLYASLAIVVFLAIFALAFFAKLHATPTYQKRPSLFTPAERVFLSALKDAAGDDYRVFGKVRIADVLAPHDRLNNAARQAALNKICAKHFDYVLCSPDDLSFVCAIELNDKSHQREDRQARDRFIADACRVAGLPLLTFPVQRHYSSIAIAHAIDEAIAAAPSAKAAEITHKATAGHSPSCPRCEIPMVKSHAKAGGRYGREFWGCQNFPKCREVVRCSAS